MEVIFVQSVFSIISATDHATAAKAASGTIRPFPVKVGIGNGFFGLAEKDPHILKAECMTSAHLLGQLPEQFIRRIYLFAGRHPEHFFGCLIIGCEKGFPIPHLEPLGILVKRVRRFKKGVGVAKASSAHARTAQD